MEQGADLIDDIWQRIFLSFGPERARLTQVSKRWRNIILNPSNWRTFEGYEISKPYFGGHSGATNARTRSLLSFVKLLTGLVDVNIKLYSTDDLETVLEPFLQIKTLRRLRLVHNYDGVPFGSNSKSRLITPRCNDLILLNLLGSTSSSPELLSSIIAGTPNLEELYVENLYQMDAALIYPLKKLQRVYVRQRNGIDLDALVAHMPQLKFVIMEKEETSFSFGSTAEPQTCAFKQIGSTILVEENFLETEDKELVRKVKDLITPAHHQHLSQMARRLHFNTDYFDFLVKELKFDINHFPSSAVVYRPEVQYAMINLNPLSTRLQTIATTIEKFGTPIEEAIRDLKHLLLFGADPKLLYVNGRAPLIEAPNQEIALFLLQHGIDIHQTYEHSNSDSDQKLPMYFHVLEPQMPDSPMLLAEIIKRVDINKEFDGYNLLQHAIACKRIYALKMLHEAGALWEANTLASIMVFVPEMFDYLITENKIDFNILSPSGVFRALERGLLPNLKEVVASLPDKADSHGLTPMHHAALTHKYMVPQPLMGFVGQTSAGVDSFNRWAAPDNRPSFSFSGPKENLLNVTRFISSAEKFSDGNTDGPGSPAGSFFGSKKDNSSTGLFGSTEPFGKTTGGFFGGNNNSGGLFGSNTSSGFNLAGNDDFGTGFGIGTKGGFNFGNRPNEDFGGFNFNGTTTAPREQERDNNKEDFMDVEARAAECDINDLMPLLKHCNINALTPYGETPLLLLVKSNLEEESMLRNLKVLLSHGADATLADNNGWTPLHAALYVGSWPIVTELLANGANLNVQDFLGVTPLMALLMGYVHNHQLPFEDIEAEYLKLISANVDLNLVDKSFGRSLMHYLACVASPAMAKFVCERNPKFVNLPDIEGFTPLHYAAMHCNLPMVKFLLENGADPNAQTTLLKLTPAMMCAHLEKEAHAFLTYSTLNSFIASQNLFLLATPIITREDRAEMLMTKYRYTEPPWTQSPRVRDSENLKNNAWKSDIEDILSLLVPLSDPHLKDVNDSTLLHHLVHLTAHNSEKHYPYLELINAQREFIPYWSVPDREENVPVKTLLKKVSSVFGSADSVLIERVMSLCKEHQIKLYNDDDDLNVISMILQKEDLFPLLSLIDLTKVPTKVTYQPPEQVTTWVDSLILSRMPVESAEKILALQPQVLNIQNSGGNTILITTVQVLLQTTARDNVDRYMQVIDMLLSKKEVDLHVQNIAGNTALHAAAQSFHLGAIDAINGNMLATFLVLVQHCLVAFKLIDAGCHLDTKNKEGKTPLDYCPRLVEYYDQYYDLVKKTMDLAKKKLKDAEESFGGKKRTRTPGFS